MIQIPDKHLTILVDKNDKSDKQYKLFAIYGTMKRI